jgi:hypothetical protein
MTFSREQASSNIEKRSVEKIVRIVKSINKDFSLRGLKRNPELKGYLHFYIIWVNKSTEIL